ncbi:MAG: TadE family protein [Kineosporiaceae bacterium]
MPVVARLLRVSAARRGVDTGAAAVEFAIISTILLTLMFGILQYGILFFQMFTAQHAAAEAASLVRTAVVTDESGDGDACDEWRQAVSESTTLAGANWDRTTWRPLDPPDDGNLRIDERVEVSVWWEPVQIAGGLIPIPWTEPRTTTVTTTLTRIGAEQAYTTPAYGCPDPGP